MKRDDVKLGIKVKVVNEHSTQIYQVKEVFYKFFCVALEYEDASGQWVSGGIIDISLIRKK